MRLRWLPRLFFIVYCVEAGVFLVMAPWSEAWERLILNLPVSGLYDLLMLPTMRGAVTGFGLIHLVWGAHDLESWMAGRRYRSQHRQPRRSPSVPR